ncbi:hypothetical protein QFZ35_003870 [Arthrobacter ulcerisalmonis]|nr:hypothetical protein [Arthrobacter ulcerisalmonis]MDQ0665372.1 hypothetical protein [Arthrobacter ulcerisalmonis]
MDDALFPELLLSDPKKERGLALPPPLTQVHNAGTGVLDSSFADRVAVLMRSRPIVDGLNNAAHQTWPTALYDIATFALATIDLVISRQGFEDEVTQEEAIRFVAALAATAAPEQQQDEHEKVAGYTINLLVNRPNHGLKFSYEISDFTASGHVRRDVKFWLLRLKEDPAHGIGVLNASPDAINALVGGLEFDVADEQVANEAMLERQLARGAFAAAEKAATLHRALSLKFTQEIQGILRDTQRDLRSVLGRWTKEVPERLDQARDHIQERLNKEYRLLVKARESLEVEDREVRAAAARIITMLEECHHRHQVLHQKVMGARLVFLDEQDRQAFRPPSLGLSLDVADDVFEPFWNLSVPLAQPLADGWLVHITGPRAPRIPDLGRMVSDLFDIRRRHEPLEEFIEPEAIGDPDPPVVAQHVRDAAIRIAAEVGLPVRISTLIVASLTADEVLPNLTDRLQAADLMTLAALWCFAPDDLDDEEDAPYVPPTSVELAAAFFGDRAISDTDGTHLTLAGWAGDDLIVAGHADQFETEPLPNPTPHLPDGLDLKHPVPGGHLDAHGQ